LASNRVPAEKLVVVHNLPDPKVFGPLGSLLGREDPDMFRISYHGTLARRLGLKNALGGLARRRAEMEQEGPWRLDILGDGDARSDLLSLTRDLGLSDRVRFSDGFVPVDELAEALRGASLGIVPNLVQRDTNLMLPTKLLEYLYLGIPAVATPTATVEGYLGSDQVTFVADPDPEAWGQAILDLRRDAEKRRAQARRGLDFFKIHSWEQEAERFLQVVGALTEAQPA
jgi:glycosyltransferase involved in cell wall biosynthesis